jgi:transposase
MLTIDQLVPYDHLVLKLESVIDFSFIYPLVKNLYSEIGRPSIDPVVLFKMIFIQYNIWYTFHAPNHKRN